MNARQLLERVETLFQQELQTKTSWGRNEVLAAYQKAQRQALLEAVERAVF